MTQNGLLPGLVMVIVGGLEAAYGLFLGHWRHLRMGRMQKASGAAMEQVEAWFRPSHGWLSGLFKRGIALALAYPLLFVGCLFTLNALFQAPNIPTHGGSGLSLPVLAYSLGISVDLVFICAALLHLLCAERIVGGYILDALPGSGYDYAKAQSNTRAMGRAGAFWSVGARFLGLVLLGIAWFIGSGIADNLAPRLQAWFGK